MQHSRIKALAAVAALGLAVAPAAHGGIVVYEDEESGKEVEIGGRIQIQYFMDDPEDGDSSDDFFFRRVRPEFEASINENWASKVQLEVGGAEDGDEVDLKDVYFQYKGWENATLTLGNSNPTFSRELLTSSKEQQLVERTFVGDHNYGVLDRFLGAKLNGDQADGKFHWGISAGVASMDPDVTRLDLDTPVNRNSDFNDGLTLSGSLDFFPMGEIDFSQGDLDHGPTRLGFRVSGYNWSNDDDNNTYTEDGVSLDEEKADIDSATGLELSLAFRSNGWSIDAQANQIDGETVVSDFTGGLFVNGETTLDSYSVEGGYVFADRFEIVAGYDSLDSDGYEDSWNRTSVGFNTFFEQHNAKMQLTYQMGENVDGVSGVDADNLYVQFQYAF